MKVCTKCNNEKPLSEYNKRAKTKDGLQHQCRECNSDNLKKHYKNNTKYYYDKAKKYKQDFYKYINDFKTNKGCAICSNENRFWVLDFHHVDDDKEYTIASLAQIQSYSKLEIEMKKCIVVCSNCHRDLHYQLRQN